VREHPYPHFPVQLLHDVIAQPGERHPALRAAVPAAGKIPDHLDPGQMRVIPAPRPRPGPPRPAAPAARQVPARTPAVLIPGRRRPRPLRRPPGHQPLQHRQLPAQPLKPGLPERATLPQPGILLPKPRILRCQTLRQPLIRLQRRRQHIPQRPVSIRLRDHASPGDHRAQQTRP
jgi:hypothetical protein